MLTHRPRAPHGLALIRDGGGRAGEPVGLLAGPDVQPAPVSDGSGQVDPRVSTGRHPRALRAVPAMPKVVHDPSMSLADRSTIRALLIGGLVAANAIALVALSVITNIATERIPPPLSWLSQGSHSWWLLIGGLALVVVLALALHAVGTPGTQPGMGELGAGSPAVSVGVSGDGAQVFIGSQVSSDISRAPAQPRPKHFGPPSTIPYKRQGIPLEELTTRLLDTGLLWLYGPSGVGKSRLATELCRKNANEFSFIFWISGDTVEHVSRDIASSLPTKTTTDPITTFRAYLDSSPDRGLVVIDNFRSTAEPVIKGILSSCARHCIIVTSQQWTPGSLSIRPLSLDSSTLDWLQDCMDLHKEEAIRSIEIGSGLPVAVLAVARCIATGRIAPDDYGIEPDRVAGDPAAEARAPIKINIQRAIAGGGEQAERIAGMLATAALAPLPTLVLQSALPSISKHQLDDSLLWMASPADGQGVLNVHEVVKSSLESVLSRDARERGVADLSQGLSQSLAAIDSGELSGILPHVVAVGDLKLLIDLSERLTHGDQQAAGKWAASLAFQWLEAREFEAMAYVVGAAHLSDVFLRTRVPEEASILVQRALQRCGELVDSRERATVEWRLYHTLGHLLVELTEMDSSRLLYAAQAEARAAELHARAHGEEDSEGLRKCREFEMLAGDALRMTTLALKNDLNDRIGNRLTDHPVRPSPSRLVLTDVERRVDAIRRPFRQGSWRIQADFAKFDDFYRAYEDASERLDGDGPDGVEAATAVIELDTFVPQQLSRSETPDASESGGVDPASITPTPQVSGWEAGAAEFARLRKELAGLADEDTPALSGVLEEAVDRVNRFGETIRERLKEEDAAHAIREALLLGILCLRVQQQLADERPAFSPPQVPSLWRHLLTLSTLESDRSFLLAVCDEAASTCQNFAQAMGFVARCLPAWIRLYRLLGEAPSADLEMWVGIGGAPGGPMARLLALLEDVRRLLPSNDSEVGPVKIRDAEDAVRGFRAAPRQFGLVREYIHIVGHVEGVDTMTSLWSHRVCVMLAEKYGVPQWELENEYRCLGHSYLFAERYSDALAAFRHAHALAVSTFGTDDEEVRHMARHVEELEFQLDPAPGEASS